MRSSAFARLVLLSLMIGGSGCADQTSIIVEVTSDLTVPDEVDELQIEVFGDGETRTERRYELSSDWPHSVSLRPGRTERGGVLISVTAFHGGEFVARRVVRSAFMPGSTVRVEVFIPRSCLGIVCAQNRDCVDGVCEDVAVPDGGMPMDAGTPDGGGCSGPTDCDDMVNCTIDRCVDGVCANDPDDSLCVDGETCDAVADCPPRVCASDGQCSDGVVCNGAEICADMTCAPGEAVDCGDGDACTADVCDEAARGECTHSTRDMDEDGFGDSDCPEVGGVAATDCNDANPEVNPDGIETCNGLDDNCDGSCDETSTCCRGVEEDCPTSCGTTGRRTCGTTCAWGVCSPPAEMCNAVDDDCNGLPDDIFACVQGASEACTTSCGTTGMRTCAGDCTWGACTPPIEICNGIDDDCEGTPDDTFACVSGSTTACATTCDPVGESTGLRTCDGTTCTLGSCVPPSEGCTGRDDDCDGMIDESVECSAGTMDTCVTSCGSTGSRVCGASCTFGACAPPPEICNGSDDDCDGTIDEGFTCVPGAMGTCTTGCSTSGTRVCEASCTWGACTPPVETCNGLDDDCDVMCDETFACCAGSSGACTTSCGTSGTRTCSGVCGWSACSPPAETCNGADDDCNGVCDDGFTCCEGSTGACTTMCGSTGSRNCEAGCSWGACTPPAEVCSGMDDDCDGTIDEGFACSPSDVGACTTTCGSTGSRSCDALCTWGTCTPPTEVCNGVDDDCDGTTDEGCGSCSACIGATSVFAPGGRYGVTLGTHAETGSCGGAGSEAYLTFTIASVSDVFITTHHASGVDTVVYVRECGCAGTERGCNDDADGLSTSVLRLNSLPAGTYNVFVDTKTAMSGTIPVDVYISAPGAESDRCGNPTFIPAGTTSLAGNTCTFGADYSPAIDTGCSFVGTGEANDRVYYFYLPSAATVAFDGCVAGSLYDETAYLRTVCSDPALSSQSACSDDGCSGAPSCSASLRSSIAGTSLSAGLHYFVADGYLGGSCDCGDFTYAITGL